MEHAFFLKSSSLILFLVCLFVFVCFLFILFFLISDKIYYEVVDNLIEYL